MRRIWISTTLFGGIIPIILIYFFNVNIVWVPFCLYAENPNLNLDEYSTRFVRFVNMVYFSTKSPTGLPKSFCSLSVYTTPPPPGFIIYLPPGLSTWFMFWASIVYTIFQCYSTFHQILQDYIIY